MAFDEEVQKDLGEEGFIGNVFKSRPEEVCELIKKGLQNEKA